MDFLSELWTTWNDNWGAGVASIAALVLVAISLAEKTRNLVSGFVRWRNIARWCGSMQNRYRMFRAKRAMRSKLAVTELRFPIDAFGRCLSQPSRTTGRQITGSIAPANPSWLNDHYVATALEALHQESKIAKAELYGRTGWPPKAEWYLFRHLKADKTAQEEIDEIETDSRCQAYQSTVNNCPMGARYEYEEFAETVSVRERRSGTYVWLKESAPPCERCWETQYRDRDIAHLVDNITRYDLADCATPEITGLHAQFQETVASVCADNQCPLEVPFIKHVVEHGIKIRQQQIQASAPPTQTEWTEELTLKFRCKLNGWLKEALRSRQG